MRKTSLFLVVVLAALVSFSMAGCAFMSEFVTEAASEMGLVGMWRMNHEHNTGNTTYHFKGDNTGTMSVTDVWLGDPTIVNLTWTRNGDKLTMNFDGGLTQTVTYSISGNTLTLTSDDGSVGNYIWQVY